jgi:tetratricopeptide (TPR) repeat protein
VEAKTLTQAGFPETVLAGNLVTQLVQDAATQKLAPKLVAAVNLMPGGPMSNQQLAVPVSNSVPARSDLLAGLEALEQALAYPSDSNEGSDLVSRAAASLTKASESDIRNPFAHMLLANCLFNQAQRAAAQGDSDQTKSAMQRFTEALKRAYRERDRAQHDFIKTEIEADYNLLVKKDYEAAIRLYQQLATVEADSKLHVALRARWMLAGIRSGDWNVPEGLIDAKEARAHLVEILAHWPDSSEAQFIKRSLRWSEEKGRNEFEHMPQENSAILTTL